MPFIGDMHNALADARHQAKYVSAIWQKLIPPPATNINYSGAAGLMEKYMLSLDCVPISTYCKETGETPDAINKRIQRGVWREGVQVLKVEGVKERWIDLSEVAKWARQNRLNSRAA
jgi:hypothetical protein